MQLLLCVNRIADFSFLEALPLAPEVLPFLYRCQYLQHQFFVCETGYGAFQVAYKTTKALSVQKFHLALKASMCNSFNEKIAVGEVVNIIKDKPGDIESDGNDLYESGLLSADSFPHFKGAFINMNNSYLNVFLDYRKVVGVTVNKYADDKNFLYKKEKYRADIETGDGLAFTYSCMSERQAFYHIACVENNLATTEKNVSFAIASLNNNLVSIIEKL